MSKKNPRIWHNAWQNLYAANVRISPRKLPISWLWNAFNYTPKKKP